MVILRQTNYSKLSDTIDEKLEEIEKTVESNKAWKKVHRASKNTEDENRIIKEIIEDLENKGVKVLRHENEQRGGGFFNTKSHIPKNKIEKFGIGKQLESIPEGVSTVIIPKDNPKLDVLAHEAKHADKDLHYRLRYSKLFGKKKIALSKLGTILEESRANFGGKRLIKKHNPSPETMEAAKKGLKVCQQDYYNKLVRKPILTTIRKIVRK